MMNNAIYIDDKDLPVHSFQDKNGNSFEIIAAWFSDEMYETNLIGALNLVICIATQESSSSNITEDFYLVGFYDDFDCADGKAKRSVMTKMLHSQDFELYIINRVINVNGIREDSYIACCNINNRTIFSWNILLDDDVDAPTICSYGKYIHDYIAARSNERPAMHCDSYCH